MESADASSPTNDDDSPKDSNLLVQTLLSVEEVYIYKIPPLKTAGGHRAEEWNLATPLATTRLLVERRGDTLVLEFLKQDNTTVFAAAVMKATPERGVAHFVESVVDSSRYFTLKIANANGRQALIGFGFRDRDAATDLRESIQHYEASMKRNALTATPLQYSIPPLAKGETIHVKTGRSKDGEASKKSPSSTTKTGKVPLLLKKPPPAAGTGTTSEQESVSSLRTEEEEAMEKLTVDLGGVELQTAPKTNDDNDEGSGDGAVFEGDDDDWESEFQSAT